MKKIVIVFISLFLLVNFAHGQNKPITPIAPERIKTENNKDSKNPKTTNNSSSKTFKKPEKSQKMIEKEEEEKRLAAIEAEKNKKLEEALITQIYSLLSINTQTDEGKIQFITELTKYLKSRNELTLEQKNSFDLWHANDEKLRTNGLVVLLQHIKSNFRKNHIMVDISPQNIESNEVIIDIRFLKPADAISKNHDLIYKYFSQNSINSMSWLDIMKNLGVKRIHFNKLEASNRIKIIDQRRL